MHRLRTALTEYAVLMAVVSLLCFAAWRISDQYIPSIAYQQPAKRSETWYTLEIAKQYGWKAEVRTSIGTRCDLLSDSLAIEVEWPTSKVFEAVGQSLHYSDRLGKPPAILFLLSDREASERDYVLDRVGDVAEKHGIKLLWYSIIDESFVED